MKKLILIFFIVFNMKTINAQTLKSGNYSSSDMSYTYTVIIKHEGNLITNTELNRIELINTKVMAEICIIILNQNTHISILK